MFAILIATHPAAAADNDDPVQLRVIPQEVALQPGGATQRVVLIAEAGANWTVASLRLHIETQAGIAAVPDAPLDQTGDFTWNVDVTATAGAVKDSTILFRVDYTAMPQKAAAGARPRTGTAAATAKVAYAPLSIAQAVKVTVHHGFDTLRPDQSGQILLTVDNDGVEPVTLEAVRPLTLDGQDRDAAGALAVRAKSLPVTIPGHDIVSVPVIVTAPGSIAQGNVALLMNLQFVRGSGPEADRAEIPVVDQVTLGIPGLSDLKTALQIPSLLFMPGVLVVLTWALLWNRKSWRRTAGDADAKFPVAAPGGEFWVVAITLSLVMVAAYPLIRHRRFDFLDSVSVTDVGILWFGSIIVVAPLTYIVAALVSRWLARREAAEAEARRFASNPIAGEKALPLLVKLAKARRTLRLPAYSVPGDDGAEIVFDLGFGEAPEGKTWVSPAILIERKSKDTTFNDAVGTLRDNDRAEELCALLAAHPGEYVIGWTGAGRITGPSAEFTTYLGEPQGSRSLIQLA